MTRTGRPESEPFIKWRINVPATTAGTVERMLWSDIHGKPIYGARGDLINKLLEHWIASERKRMSGQDIHIPPLPTTEDILS